MVCRLLFWYVRAWNRNESTTPIVKIEIRDIQRGSGNREKYVYAQLFINDELAISATLDYVIKALKERYLNEQTN